MSKPLKILGPRRYAQRSPDHPWIGLERAIKCAAAIQKLAGPREVSLGQVHEAWGSVPWKGTTCRITAALKYYGLVHVFGNGRRRTIKLTAIGDRITQKNVENRQALVRKAALTPAIHQEILERFKDEGLPPDEKLTEYLRFERREGQRFNPLAARACITKFRKSLKFAGLTAADLKQIARTSHHEKETGEAEASRLAFSTFSTLDDKSMTPPGMKDLQIPLPSLQVAFIRIPYPMDEDDHEALMRNFAGFKNKLTENPAT